MEGAGLQTPPYKTLQAASPEKPSTMRSFFASAGQGGEGSNAKGPVLGPLVPKTLDTPPTSMLFASLASPGGGEGIHSAAAGRPRPVVSEEDEEEQELLAQVEASQGRAKKLEKAMAEEEEIIQQMAGEELRLHRLHERLLRELPQQAPPTAVCGSLGAAEAQASLAPRESPRSLADLSNNLKSVKQLRRRVKELEAALDSREEQVIALTDQLEMGEAPVAAFSASPATAAASCARSSWAAWSPACRAGGVQSPWSPSPMQ